MGKPKELHTAWKNLKNKHGALLKREKLNFNKGMGPLLDTMDSKAGTKDASNAALKVHQYAIDYHGAVNKSGLDEEVKKSFLAELLQIKELAAKTPQVK